MVKTRIQNRWRLLLGAYSDNRIQFATEEGENNESGNDTGSDEEESTSSEQEGSNDQGNSYQKMDAALEFLYKNEYGDNRGVREGRQATLEASVLSVPDWITSVRELFPKEAREILESHALERYNLTDLLTDKEILENLEPNISLLKSIIQMKDLFARDVLQVAQTIVEKVVRELIEKMSTEIRRSIIGKRRKNSTSNRPSMQTIDFKKTLLKNLKNYDTENQRIVLDKIYCNSLEKKYNPWDVIVLVDQSGSMLDSVIYSSVMAAIFSRLSNIRTRLIAFDTAFVDLSDYADDAVKTLMKVQLGGGTDIAQALQYGYSLIENPQKTIVILISDLYEGGSYSHFYRVADDIISAEAKFIVLPSLNYNAIPEYDKEAAKRLKSMGAEVGALTPNQLADWIGGIIK